MPLDLNQMEKDFKNRSQGGMAGYWQPQEGDNRIRVLPHTLQYFDGPITDIGFRILVHYDIGPAGSKSRVVCPHTFDIAGDPEKGTPPKKHKCPICEWSVQLRNKGDDAAKALNSKIYARKRWIINVLDLNAQDKGIQPLECGSKIRDQIVSYCNPKWGDPLDIGAGRDFTLTMTIPQGQKKDKADYKVVPDPTNTSIKSKLPANWKEQIAKLATLVPKAMTYDQIRAVMDGIEDAGSGAADVAAAHSESTSASTSAPHTAAQTPASSDPVNPAPPPAQPPAADASGRPVGFGQEYSTLDTSKCAKCGAKIDCKAEFLR
jgi:hypothetical protein